MPALPLEPAAPPPAVPPGPTPAAPAALAPAPPPPLLLPAVAVPAAPLLVPPLTEPPLPVPPEGGAPAVLPTVPGLPVSLALLQATPAKSRKVIPKPNAELFMALVRARLSAL